MDAKLNVAGWISEQMGGVRLDWNSLLLLWLVGLKISLRILAFPHVYSIFIKRLRNLGNFRNIVRNYSMNMIEYKD